MNNQTRNLFITCLCLTCSTVLAENNKSTEQPVAQTLLAQTSTNNTMPVEKPSAKDDTAFLDQTMERAAFINDLKAICTKKYPDEILWENGKYYKNNKNTALCLKLVDLLAKGFAQTDAIVQSKEMVKIQCLFEIFLYQIDHFDRHG